MPEFVGLDPQTVDSGTMYDVLVTCIQPRPIAFVSTLDGEGKANLAPFSFFMPGGANPASLAFSVTLASNGRRKDTLRNIEATGEFVVNIVTRGMADGMNATSFSYPHGESEWPIAGFTPLVSEMVGPFRVGESPAQFECRVYRIIDHGTSSGAAVYVIGEVLKVHVLANLWSNGELKDLYPIARLDGPGYLDTATNSRFQMDRPQ